MADAPSDPRTEPHESTPVNGCAGSGRSEDGQPRLVEEHHVVGPYGEDEIEATDERGRRWYHLRPEPRRRVDLIGFNYTWWLVIWALIIFALIPWGGGWGY